MHPILAQRGTWLLWALIWIAVGAALGLLLATLERLTWWAGLTLIVPITLIYGFICSGSYYLCNIAPLRRSATLRIIGIHGMGAMISSSIWLQIGEGWSKLLKELPWLPDIDRHFWNQSPLFVSLGVVLFLLSSAVHYILVALAESRDAETRALRLHALATEAELRALRSQITPHFLFNALNSISALTSTDAAGARRMCLLLSDFLRGTLKVSSQERIPLAQELSLIDQYLAIEQVRFGERLQIARAIDDEAAHRLIPPLLLQPLVENAITHGISDLLDGGTIGIAARAEGQRLHVTIENPRDPEGKRRAGAGLGLTNVRRRLDAAFGLDASVIVDAAPQYFRVELTLPAPDPMPVADAAAPDATAATTAPTIASSTAPAPDETLATVDPAFIATAEPVPLPAPPERRKASE